MASVAASGPISFADIQAVMGGSGPVSIQDYIQSAATGYTRGIPGIGDTNVGIADFQGKSKALVSGLQYRLFRRRYAFSTAATSGAAGTGSYGGGGGAAGVSVLDFTTAMGPASSATAASGTFSGGAGTGLGAGGGGTGVISARYVTFQYGNAYGAGRCMNLGGVRVYSSSGGGNIIVRTMAVEVLDNYGSGFVASNMVDNDDNTMYHSSCGSEYPWVKVDLGSEQPIFRVELTNRADCCRSRIAGMTLQLQNNSGTVIYTSGLCALNNGATNYQEGMLGYFYYTFWPSINTTPYGSDSTPNTSQPSFTAGQGASGFAYIQLGATEYFTNSSASYTFPAAGTARLLLMGGGGGGGANAGTNNRGGGGGGAGYLQSYFISVSNGTVATITVGGPGTQNVSGGTTSVVINSITYSAAGGGNGNAAQTGGAGSTAGGTGGSAGAAGAGGTQSSAASIGHLTNGGGYFADDTTWFDSRTENYPAGLVSDFTSINTATGGIVPTDNTWETYSVEWFGYFYATATTTYTFYTVSDDSSYMWIGASALSGYTAANSLVNNGGLHGAIEKSGSISLTAGTYYPIRCQFGENFSGDSFTFSFSTTGIARTYNLAGYVYYGMGTYSSFPINHARLLRATNTATVDRSYFVNVAGTATPTYCLMNSKWDGGGWMMMMKATRGTTFPYSSTYWTSTGTTLNTGSTDRTDADAKFTVMNQIPVKDVLALWPDVGTTGGSISQTEAWSWLINNYYYGGTRVTPIVGFSASNSRDATTHFLNTSDQTSFAGYSASIWSQQAGAKRHVFGGGAHLSANVNIRWGMIWNNEGDFATADVTGGLGMSLGSYSAGDFYGGAGTSVLNRTMRVELYGR